MNSDVQAFYDQYPYPNMGKIAQVRAPKSLFEHLCQKVQKPIPSDPSILVVGCGTTAPSVLAHLYPQASRIVVVDISPKTLAIAKKKCSSRDLKKMTWVHADIETTSLLELLDGQTFDWIHATGVFHHINSPLKALKNVSSVLKDSGIIKFQVYSKGGRFWIELARQFFLSHAIQNQPEAKNKLLKLSSDNPIRFAVATYPESLNEHGFCDGFLNPTVKLFYLDEWLQLFNQSGLSLTYLEKVSTINDLKEILPATLFKTISSATIETQIALMERLGEWRSDFNGVLVKMSNPTETSPLQSYDNTLALENRSFPRLLLWAGFKEALLNSFDTLTEQDFKFLVENLYERQWTRGLLGWKLRLKWSAFSDKARINASFDTILRERLPLLYEDYLNTRNNPIKIPSYDTWPMTQWADGMVSWDI